MKRRMLSWIVIAMISWTPLLSAQDQNDAPPPKEVQSPFQEEIEYKPGQLLELNLLIDGIHWTSFKIGSQNTEDLKPGKTTKIEVINTLENRSSHSRVISIVILLENETGNLLQRLSMGEVKLSKGKYRTDRQKFKVETDALIGLSKIYIFAETK